MIFYIFRKITTITKIKKILGGGLTLTRFVQYCIIIDYMYIYLFIYLFIGTFITKIRVL